MGIQMDLEASHVLSLIVALDIVTPLSAAVRDLLPAIALEWSESECVVRVESVGAVLPDQLCGDAVGFGRVGVVEVQSLFPVSIVGEAVRLSGNGGVDERVVHWVVEVETSENMT